MIVVTLEITRWNGIKHTFLTSVPLNFFSCFSVGAFQLSDIFYNILDGLLGSLIYYIGYKISMERKTNEEDNTFNHGRCYWQSLRNWY